MRYSPAKRAIESASISLPSPKPSSKRRVRFASAARAARSISAPGLALELARQRGETVESLLAGGDLAGESDRLAAGERLEHRVSLGDGAFDQDQSVAVGQAVAHQVGDQRGGAVSQTAQTRGDRCLEKRQESRPRLLRGALAPGSARAARSLAGEQGLWQRRQSALGTEADRIEIEEPQDLKEPGRGVARLAGKVVGPAAPGQLLADLLEKRRRRRAVREDAALDDRHHLAVGEE